MMKPDIRWPLFLVLGGLLSAAADPVRAQVSPLQQAVTSDLPGQEYWLAFGPYFEGEYRRAGNDFAQGAQTAFKSGQNRFLDSCCYWVMNGEARFHLGDYAGAINQYEQAIALYLQFTRDNWQGRVTQPNISTNNSAVQRAQVTWYTPRRNMVVPGLPDTMQMMFGRLDAERAFSEGGVVQNAELHRVNVIEIMRTVAIALQRRRWIKGDICQHDPLSRQILDGLKLAGTGDATLLSRCNQVLLGLAVAGTGDLDRAREVLAGSLQFGAGMDHPLTAIAMLELARIQLQQDDPASAAGMALEASFAAAVFSQYDIVEQALALGTEIHLRSDRSLYPPLPAAIVWANRNRARAMQVSLAVRQADCLAEAGSTAASIQLLDDAQRLGTRSDILRGPLSGRLGYLRAVNLFSAGSFDPGSAALAEGLKGFAAGSRWLYQIGLVNSLVANGGVTGRQADLLYGLLLGDPQEIHWRSDPIEAMSFLTSAHLSSIEAWLDIAIENRSYDRAVEIAELLRRHRFYATQPLAGRLVSMRWMMHGYDEAVGEKALAQRADFMTRLPAYAELTLRAGQVRQALLGIPLQPPADSDREKEQRDLFVQAMQIGAQQESLLASLALKREPATMVFSPSVDLSTLRSGFGPDTTVLYAVETERSCHLFEISARGTKLLATHKVREVSSFVNRVLKELALVDRQLTAEQLQGSGYRESVWELTGKFLPGFEPASLGGGGGLLLVPDGSLWNLPFEALLFGADAENSRFLADLCVPRYAPTLYLGLEAGRRWKKPVRSAFFPGQPDRAVPVEIVREATVRMAAGAHDTGTWEDRLMIPSSLLSHVVDQVVVLTGMEMPRKAGPFALLPMQKDIGRTGNSLAAWQSLPFDGPDVVVMPCFEPEGAYGVAPGLGGQDLFITSMAMIASGSRTILFSRWPTRGKSVVGLTEEFLRGLADLPPAVALHQATHWMRKQPLEFAFEPRAKAPADPADVLCDHPLFWAGYLVIDLPVVNPPEWTGMKEGVEGAGDVAQPPEVMKPGEPGPEAGNPTAGGSGAQVPDAGKVPPVGGGETGSVPPAEKPPADKPPGEPPVPPPGSQGGGTPPAGSGSGGGGKDGPGISGDG